MTAKKTKKQRKKTRKAILLSPVKPSEEFMWQKWKQEIDDPMMQKFNLVALIFFIISLAAYAYTALTSPTDVKTVDLLGSFIGIIVFAFLLVEAGYLVYKFFAGKRQGSPLLAFKDPTVAEKQAQTRKV